MKKELLRSLKFPFFFSFVIALVECIVVVAIAWATVNGREPVPLEYTKSGEVATSIIMLIPLLSLIAVLFIRLVKLYRCKSDKKCYAVEIAGHILGLGVGILIFILIYEFEIPLLSYLLREASRLLITLIRNAGLVKYPIP